MITRTPEIEEPNISEHVNYTFADHWKPKPPEDYSLEYEESWFDEDGNSQSSETMIGERLADVICVCRHQTRCSELEMVRGMELVRDMVFAICALLGVACIALY
jgi:N-acetylglutamate synthase-like GNAT family acetyltransferase